MLIGLLSLGKFSAETSHCYIAIKIGSPYDQNQFKQDQYIKYVDNCGHANKIGYQYKIVTLRCYKLRH